MTASADRHTRWNFTVIVLDASAFMAGFAFIDPVAVLPILMGNLTKSKVLIGLMGALQRAGWLLPQLLATSFVLHRPRKKPFILIPCIISRIPFVLLAIAFCSPWGAAHRGALLVLLVATYGFFFFGDGLSGVPWHDTIARTIPSQLRGRFFGSMQFLSGVLALGSGAIVGRVLGNEALAFPRNYGILLVWLCLGLGISTLFLALIREPASESVEEARSFAQIVRSIPETLRRHPLLRRVIITQNLCGMAALALPFYAVYAEEGLRVPAGMSGVFIWAQTVGSVGMSLVWAYVNDRVGSRAVIRGVASLAALVPLAALLIPPMARMLRVEQATGYLYAMVFLLSGATWGGAWMGFTTYVMELARDDIRPLFLGLQATLCAPTVVMPLLGGWLLSVAPYQGLFGIVAVAGVVSMIWAWRLAEPHRSERADR